MKFLTNLDLSRNQLLNFRLQQLGSAPSTPVESLVYYDTTTHEPFVYNGTDWISFLAAGGAPDWADITGTPTTIAGYGITDAVTLPITQSDVTGLTAALDLLAPKASPTFTGVPLAPTAAPATSTTQIATTAFTMGAIADLVASAPSTLNTLNEIATALGNDPNLSATLTAAIGLKADAANAALTGVPTAPTATGGTNTTQLATTEFVQAAVGAGTVAHKYATSLGDGVETSFVVTHNLGNRDLTVTIAETATPYNVIQADVQFTSTTTATITFAVPPTTNQYRATFFG